MHKRNLALALLLIAAPSFAQTKTIAERLGYPADSKLLILHADDLAVAHSQDAASFDALDQHAVTSASIMVPCPWLTEVADYAKAHPDADLGLHLTLTSEWKTYRWGPVASKDKVPSLLDPSGYLWPGHTSIPCRRPESRRGRARKSAPRSSAPSLWESIPPTSTATWACCSRAPNFSPSTSKSRTNINCLSSPSSPPTLQLNSTSLLSSNDILINSVIIADPSVHPADWNAFYANAIKNLKPGLTEIIVHLGHDDAELQAVMVDHADYGSAWRQRDYDAVTSPEFKKLIEDNHVILIAWKDLKKLLQ